MQQQKPLTPQEGFEGFDDNDQTALPTDEEKSEDDGESRTEEEADTASQNRSSTLLSHKFQPNEVRTIIDQVVDRLTPILQATCVTDRVEKAERNADEWRSLANLMMSNPHFATKKLSIGAHNEGFAMARAHLPSLGRHPMEQTWDNFIQTPLATPLWTLIMKLDLHPTSSVFTRWWKKTKSDTRNDTWSKLSKYLQSIRYFNHASDEFWRKYSVNPTYFSIQKLATELITQGNWLKASGLDLQKTIDKYFEAATEIASSSGKVEDIDQILNPLWPALFRPHRLHYEGEPFGQATLFAQEDPHLCDNSAQLKGFKFSMKPESTSTALPTVQETQETSSSTLKEQPKLSTVSRMIEEILNGQK